jgi:hypothetical protein
VDLLVGLVVYDDSGGDDAGGQSDGQDYNQKSKGSDDEVFHDVVHDVLLERKSVSSFSSTDDGTRFIGCGQVSKLTKIFKRRLHTN